MSKALLIICMLFPAIAFAQIINGKLLTAQPLRADVNKDNAAYLAFTKAITDSISDLIVNYQATPAKTRNNTKFKENYNAQLLILKTHQKQRNQRWIKSHPNSYSSLTALKYAGNPYQDYQEAVLLFNSLADSIKNSVAGKSYAVKLEKFHTPALNTMAPGFNEPTPDGLITGPAAFRGKYLLIDFWASWCVPCRHENPALVKTFKKFKAKNFSILGVSLDKADGKANWLAAIKNDGVTWTNVSDLQGWDNTAAKTYGIRAIPQNFLLDPDGKIIAKNLFGKALDDKLEEILR